MRLRVGDATTVDSAACTAIYQPEYDGASREVVQADLDFVSERQRG